MLSFVFVLRIGQQIIQRRELWKRNGVGVGKVGRGRREYTNHAKERVGEVEGGGGGNSKLRERTARDPGNQSSGEKEIWPMSLELRSAPHVFGTVFEA